MIQNKTEFVEKICDTDNIQGDLKEETVEVIKNPGFDIEGVIDKIREEGHQDSFFDLGYALQDHIDIAIDIDTEDDKFVVSSAQRVAIKKILKALILHIGTKKI